MSNPVLRIPGGRPRRIAFYPTGHGFGHSTRVIEVIRHLSPETGVHVRTSVPEWLYRLDLDRPFHFHDLYHDVGCYQVDSLEVSARGTLIAFAQLWDDRDDLIREEVEFLHRHEIDLVVADISPLACRFARAAGLPAIVIANFAWNWIYAPYLDGNEDFTPLIAEIEDCYRYASLCLRTPFAADLSVFPAIRDVPLIARHARTPADAIRRELGVPDGHRLVLLTFGGFPTRELPLEPASDLEGVTFVTTIAEMTPQPNLIRVPGNRYYHPDLVAAADLVVAKPGYGTFAECAANNTPVLFNPRDDFREYAVLRDETLRLNAGRLIPLEDLLGGRLGRHVREMLEAGLSWPAMRTDGGCVAAEILESF